MLVSMLIGFGVGMVLLSPMQDPAINMAIASTGRSVGGHSGMGALARSAAVWPLGFVNQQRQPLAAFKLRGLHNIVSGKAIDPTIARAAYGGSRIAYTRPVVVRAESQLLQRLEEAIKVAQQCTGDCAVEWDNVEELSAAVAHGQPKKTLKSEPLQLSSTDMEAFKASMEKLAAARAKVSKEAVTAEVKAEIQSALEEKSEVVSKVARERMTRFETKIQEAIATATASKSPVDWDIVEELMQERSHLKKFGGSS